ncbi:MAG TPA: hypothetical protein VHO72_08305 [Bacteroidales bacterium]|nr:hypothetical protein [Bacteroidales bacterium]
MSVWWLYIMVSQLVWIGCGDTCSANNADYYVINSEASVSSYSYCPSSHQITDLGLSYESIPVNTFFKKKDFRNYVPFQVYANSKLYINITYVLPVNPLVCHHWICRIQV